MCSQLKTLLMLKGIFLLQFSVLGNYQQVCSSDYEVSRGYFHISPSDCRSNVMFEVIGKIGKKSFYCLDEYTVTHALLHQYDENFFSKITNHYGDQESQFLVCLKSEGLRFGRETEVRASIERIIREIN